jgi:hypothetical protein
VAAEPGVLGLHHPNQRLQCRQGQTLHPLLLQAELADQAGDLLPQDPPHGLVLHQVAAPRDRVGDHVLDDRGIGEIRQVIHRSCAEAAHRRAGIVPRTGGDDGERRLPREALGDQRRHSVGGERRIRHQRVELDPGDHLDRLRGGSHGRRLVTAGPQVVP